MRTTHVRQVFRATIVIAVALFATACRSAAPEADEQPVDPFDHWVRRAREVPVGMTRDEVLRLLPPMTAPTTFYLGSGYVLFIHVSVEPYICVGVPFKHSGEVFGGKSVSVDGLDRTELIVIEGR